MEALVIPIARRVAHQTQITTLDGVPYRLTFGWNGRIARWFLDLETATGTAILSSQCVVLGADLLRRVRADPSAPQGALALVDLEGRGAEAGLDSLGERHRLVYFAAE